MEVCLAAGGSITGEHGVGSDKIEYMPAAFDLPSLELMCEVRRVFDPDGRANPGKMFPRHTCREWRRRGAA
jgi:glycolate oxidase